MKDLKKRFPVYSRMIKLFPAPYREQYEREMLQTTADMLDGATTISAKAAIWLRLAVDLPTAIGRQQLQYAGGIMHNETPRYIKRNSLIAGLLLLPFFVVLTGSSLDKIINNRTLLDSWFWRMPMLGIWVLRLPELAFLLVTGSYVAYVIKAGSSQHTSWLKRAIDIKHSWPIILPGLGAIGILFIVAFHDSAQCFMYNPIHLAGHLQQTWRCAVPQSALRRHVFLW